MSESVVERNELFLLNEHISDVANLRKTARSHENVGGLLRSFISSKVPPKKFNELFFLQLQTYPV